MPFILFIVLLGALGACGKDKSKSPANEEHPQREMEAPENDQRRRGFSRPGVMVQSQFETVFEGTLKVTGRRCQGGEILTTHWRRRPSAYECLPDQWIITMINTSACTGEICSEEYVVQTFLANIRLAPVGSPRGIANYYIRPFTPLSNENWKILHRTWLRSDLQGIATLTSRAN